ncbi:BTB/POZ and MATH domain-containing protein 2-like protein [Carex littledalei]|uniref:BTB/POZ and MATH domain-containing protein 2-like protein n=1 Tax=Carex littledalei TaxID=544730 RepID=A0A833VLL7_9POAL|nr:BTB/POZ and MATH domain-containing protein 2-like protein [Carex littledalei]
MFRGLDLGVELGRDVETTVNYPMTTDIRTQMGSSDQAINHQNLEIASTIRTENITGSHLFKILVYSLTKGIGTGKHIESNVFTVGGYNWKIYYYPDGSSNDNKDFISIYFGLESEATNVKARTTFIIPQQNGAPSNMIFESPLHTFNSNTDQYARFCGARQFAKRTEFEASDLLNDDAFTIMCIVTVVKKTKLDVPNPALWGHCSTVELDPKFDSKYVIAYIRLFC